jgi:hypothetical protein
MHFTLQQGMRLCHAPSYLQSLQSVTDRKQQQQQ